MASSPSSTATSIAPFLTPSSTDRKSTRLNSSHLGISYAVFCLEKKKDTQIERAAIAVVAALPYALHPYCRKPSEHARHVSVAHHHAHHNTRDVGIHHPTNIDQGG